MALIQWKDEYRTGVSSVDHEHEALVQIINETAEQIQPGTNADDIRDYLAEIHTMISSHFALEERVMLNKAYDKYAEHKDDHDKLLEEIGDIMEEVDLNEALATQQSLAERLDKWFSVHFATHDRHLHKLAGL